MTNRKSYRVRKKYLWSFFVVAICIVMAITTVMFSFYSGTQIEKSKENSVYRLEQAGYQIDTLYDVMNSVSNQILQDKDTYACLLSKKLDRLRETKACIKLREIQSTNPFLRYVSFFNAYSNRLLSNSYAGFLSREEISDLYEALGDNSYACITRKVGDTYLMQSDKTSTVYTFLLKVSPTPKSPDNLIILDFHPDYFKTVIDSLRVGDQSQQIILLSNKDRILSYHDAPVGSAHFEMSNSPEFSDTGLGIFSLVQTSTSSGQFNHNSSEFPHSFITYATAERSGISVVSIVPHSVILSGLYPLMVFTVVTALATLFLGYLISVKMSRTLYAPIQKLYENYVRKSKGEKAGNELEELSLAFADVSSRAGQLEQGLLSAYNDSKRLYLDYLFRGNIHEIGRSESAYQKFGIDLASPYYTVILLECCMPNDYVSSGDLFLSYYALENVTKEIVSPFGQADMLRVDGHSFAVLLPLKEDVLPEGLIDHLKTINEVMQKEFSVTVTICVGKVVESYLNINMCFESTRIALSSAPYKDQGSVFLAGIATDTITAGQYYNKLHHKLADYIRTEDIDPCSREFDLALSSMENVSFQTAKSYFNHVMMLLLDNFSSALEKDDDSFGEFTLRLDEVMFAQNVSDMKKSFLEFLTLLMHRLALGKKRGNQDVVETVKDFIDKNYANSDLSLGMMANIVGLSPPYLGKLFTSVTTMSFNDYLNRTRMDHAAKMLTETKVPICQVSEAVGILNTNYFYSVFKKRFGSTPSAYRKSNTES